MAEAKLYGQNKGGMSINGIIKDYYAYAGENISAGDLVEYVNGIASKTEDYETQVRKVTTGQFDGIAKTSGEGGDDTGHKDIVSIWTKE